MLSLNQRVGLYQVKILAFENCQLLNKGFSGLSGSISPAVLRKHRPVICFRLSSFQGKHTNLSLVMQSYSLPIGQTCWKRIYVSIYSTIIALKFSTGFLESLETIKHGMLRPPKCRQSLQTELGLVQFSPLINQCLLKTT